MYRCIQIRGLVVDASVVAAIMLWMFSEAKKMKGLMRDPIFAKVAFRLKRQRWEPARR